MECYWCGKENKNLEINEKGKILRHFPCNKCNQPERSKREDHNGTMTLQYDMSRMPNGCGALNTMET